MYIHIGSHVSGLIYSVGRVRDTYILIDQLGLIIRATC